MDEFGPDEQKWLDVLRAADEPSPEDRARVRAVVLAGIAGAGAGAAAGAAGIAKSGAVAKTAGAASLFAGGWKIGVAVVSIVIAGGAAAVMLGKASNDRAVTSIDSTSTIAPRATLESEQAAQPASVVAPEGMAAPKTITSTEIAQAAEPTIVRGADAPKPLNSAPARAPIRSAVSRPSKPAPGDDVEAELLLMTQAQRSLERSDPNGALATLAHHGRNHPHGVFAVEREGLRAIASCEAKRAEGRSLAERFVSHNPKSPLVTRVRAACLSP
ncbi:MAG: hypothetical protein BGO98_01600 [Myxococcales bacterium 68-20]|nr:MAG: hypothetical protein BGO98_01600 [Myxococcales bacterium 68-20]